MKPAFRKRQREEISLMVERSKILQQIKQAALEVDPSAQVILFGSQARGDMHDESDWDVLVLTNMAVSLKLKQRYRRRFLEIQLNQGVDVNAIVKNRAYWQQHQAVPFFKAISREGIPI